MSEPRFDDVVMVTRGKHKGTVGYYDDDDGPQNAIVYPEGPMVGAYIVVRQSSLRVATAEERAVWMADVGAVEIGTLRVDA